MSEFPESEYTRDIDFARVFSQIKMYQLSRLLHDHYRDLYEHLERHEIVPTFYAAPWFLTLFASQFPIGFVARVFGESRRPWGETAARGGVWRGGGDGRPRRRSLPGVTVNHRNWCRLITLIGGVVSELGQ